MALYAKTIRLSSVLPYCLRFSSRNIHNIKHTPRINVRSVLKLCCGGFAGYYVYKSIAKYSFGVNVNAKGVPAAGERLSHLPFYSEDEVSKHNSKATRIWVTFHEGVYDITDFVESHPGGNKILLAAGASLEPYWALYAVHKRDEVFEILEQYRIGNLTIDHTKKKAVDPSDPFADEPKRNPALRVTSAKPFNAETPPEIAADHFITPNEFFFVRNHLPVPKVDISKYRLDIYIGEDKVKSLSFDEIRSKFAKRTLTAAVQCSGNRRSEMSTYKEVKGLSWSITAISNAQWSGASLREVLTEAGINESQSVHIQFEGLDTDPTGAHYGASIPTERALDAKSDVLLAYEMNGEPLPLDHGFPVRVIVPGVIGARQVKWLQKIVASQNESPSHWQQNDYKVVSPSTEWATADFSKIPAVQEAPVQSAICVPRPGEEISHDDGQVTMKGYAWSGGGRAIIRVDVSPDGGNTWIEADLQKEERPLNRAWAWTLWSVNVPIPKDHQGKLTLVCKAVDSSHNGQPEGVNGIWNLRGLLNNSWHKVDVTVQ